MPAHLCAPLQNAHNPNRTNTSTIVLLGVTASPPIGELDAGSIDFEMKVFDRAMIVSDAGGGPTS
jgi:hypothetical protein